MEQNAEYILSVAVPRPIEGLFTYRLPSALASKIQVGGWVQVPFGRTKTHAFIVEPAQPFSNVPAHLHAHELKEILAVGGSGVVFSEDLLQLCRWTADYYRMPLGEVLGCAASPASLGLKTSRTKSRELTRHEPSKPIRHEMTEDQKKALQILEKHQGTALLHGITGSGKTELYIELAKQVLEAGKNVLLLAPEIALTPQLHRRLEAGLGLSVSLWHSALPNGKRRDHATALRSGELRVVVGARSAVFAPVQNLGLIIVDEEHDPTYKQEDRVKYNARDLAVVRGKITGSLVVLGSATPSLETRERVREGRYGIARLPKRISSSGLPEVDIVNLCEEEKVHAIQAPLATRTLQAIRDTLEAGNQVMVFLNRRGFASFLLCRDCGEVPQCQHCSVSLTVHKKLKQLRCHTCGYQEGIHHTCQKCRGIDLAPMGAGTESLEDELPALLPRAVPLRLDRDQVTSATRLDRILDEFRQGKANLLLGTQMLVKGHDFPGVTLVVVILADSLFRWPDFRAPERAFQILTQVAGRAGRGETAGKVLIQTFQPDHPVIRAVKGEISEEDFLTGERELRQVLSYPPFGRLARLRFENTEQGDAKAHASEIAKGLGPLELSKKLQILGPSEAFLERAKGIYRWDLLLKGTEIRILQQAVSRAKALCAQKRWQLLVDIDPYGIG